TGRLACGRSRLGPLDSVNDGVAYEMREDASQDSREVRWHPNLTPFDLEAGLLSFLLAPRRNEVEQVGRGLAERARGEPRRHLSERVAAIADQRQEGKK